MKTMKGSIYVNSTKASRYSPFFSCGSNSKNTAVYLSICLFLGAKAPLGIASVRK